MAGLSTYHNSMRQQSADVGFAIMQAFTQGYITNTQVVNATSAQDLIDNVNAAVVGPGAEANAQRLSITRALAVGLAMGDLSATRVQAATSASDLAQTYTWLSDWPASLTGQLGPNLIS